MAYLNLLMSIICFSLHDFFRVEYTRFQTAFSFLALIYMENQETFYQSLFEK